MEKKPLTGAALEIFLARMREKNYFGSTYAKKEQAKP
jgi:hypothetical protein